LLEVQATVALMSAVVPFEKVPVATYFCVPAIATVAVAGVTLIEVSSAGVTVTVVDAVWPPKAPVISELPTAIPVVRPVVAPAVTSVGAAEVKAVFAVTSTVVASEYVAVTVS
jgi:hypothetical protein